MKQRLPKSFSNSKDESEYPISFKANPSLEELGVLHVGLADYAKLKKELDPVESFAFFTRDQDGQVLAGCQCEIIYGCLYTASLWVSEALRGKGIGTKLLKAAEQFAIEKGCTMATINTFDWEALEFYQGLGYKVDLAREGYKNNSTFYFLKKELF